MKCEPLRCVCGQVRSATRQCSCQSETDGEETIHSLGCVPDDQRFLELRDELVKAICKLYETKKRRYADVYMSSVRVKG